LKVNHYQTICLIHNNQLKGKILPMPDGEQSSCYLVEIIEEKIQRQKEESNVGCMIVVPKDKAFKYIKKVEGDKSETRVVFNIQDIVVQYQDIKDPRVLQLTRHSAKKK